MIFKEFAGDDIRTRKNYLTQMVDISNTDISGSTTRKKHQVFVTGSSVGPGVTSSLFQTVFDQDFTLQTANPVFDMTVGLASGSEVINDCSPTIDQNGKYLFPQTSLMMREKMDLYRLFAQNLLGDADAIFTATSGSNSSEIKEALFIGFKRLFARDQIKRETFAIRLNPTGSTTTVPNLDVVGDSATKIYTDINSSLNKEYLYGGQVSTVVDSANAALPLGLLFLDKGVLVLDISRSFDMAVELTGSIDAVTSTGETDFSGSLRYFLSSGSLDDLIDHFASTRFSGSNQSSVVFQNVTNINSTIYYARLGADEFNYSSNPTFTDENNRIVVIDEGQEELQKSFTFITSFGLYDARNNLLAVAKASRPLYKDNERSPVVQLRLDF